MLQTHLFFAFFPQTGENWPVCGLLEHFVSVVGYFVEAVVFSGGYFEAYGVVEAEPGGVAPAEQFIITPYQTSRNPVCFPDPPLLEFLSPLIKNKRQLRAPINNPNRILRCRNRRCFFIANPLPLIIRVPHIDVTVAPQAIEGIVCPECDLVGAGFDFIPDT